MNKLLFNKHDKYLITTDAWFIGNSGRQYRAVWGKVEVFSDDSLGISTNRSSTNWYLKVGTKNNHVIIAGCQIHYAVRSDEKPKKDAMIDDWTSENGKCNLMKTPTKIYITD